MDSMFGAVIAPVLLTSRSFMHGAQADMKRCQMPYIWHCITTDRQAHFFRLAFLQKLLNCLVQLLIDCDCDMFRYQARIAQFQRQSVMHERVDSLRSSWLVKWREVLQIQNVDKNVTMTAAMQMAAALFII